MSPDRLVFILSRPDGKVKVYHRGQPSIEIDKTG